MKVTRKHNGQLKGSRFTGTTQANLEFEASYIFKKTELTLKQILPFFGVFFFIVLLFIIPVVARGYLKELAMLINDDNESFKLPFCDSNLLLFFLNRHLINLTDFSSEMKRFREY